VCVRLSLIIPVYNAEKTLLRTLRSLESISLKNRHLVEVLLIDDGSRDASWKLLGDWAAIHEGSFQVRRFQQQNAGAGAARNTGLSQATGEWVHFIDADDELRIDPIEWIQKHANATSIAFGVEFRKRGQVVRKSVPRSLPSKHQFRNLLTADNPFTIPSLVFKRELIQTPFLEGVLLEDWLFWCTNEPIFETMVTEPNVVAATIHLHGQNTSAQYERMGANRSKVAAQLLESQGMSYSRYQKNNLLVQQAIGRLQQRRFPNPISFLRWPCQLRLYVKFCLYFVAAVFGIRLTRYS